MTRFFLILAIASLLTSCSTTKFREMSVSEISNVMGQWNYDLLDSEGNKVKGFFQVDPSSRENFSVRGQSFLDSGETLGVLNLRGVWTGVMKHGEQPGLYVLTFSTKENPIFPNSVSKEAQEGTVILHHQNNMMSGSFKVQVPKDGPRGTLVARKHE